MSKLVAILISIVLLCASCTKHTIEAKNLSSTLQQDNAPGEVIAEINKILEANPKRTTEQEYWMLLGIECQALFTVRKYEQSIECAKSCLKLMGSNQVIDKVTESSLLPYSGIVIYAENLSAMYAIMTTISFETGETDKALFYYEEFEKIINDPKIERIMKSYGHFYSISKHYAQLIGIRGLIDIRKGNYKNIDKYINKISELEGTSQVNDLNNLKKAWICKLLVAKGNYLDAEQRLEETDDIDIYNIGNLVLAIANVVVGNPSFLINAAMAAMAISRENDLEHKTLRAFIRIKILLHQEKYELAKNEIDILLAQEWLSEYPTLKSELLADSATICLKINDPQKAKLHLKESIDIVESMRSTIGSDLAKIGFSGDNQKYYYSLINIFLEEKNYNKALEYIERAKSRALVDLLATKNEFTTNPTARKLLEEISERNKNIRFQVKKKGDNNNDHQTRGIEIVKEELIRESPKLASVISVIPYSFEEIRNMIDPDETVIEYFGFKDQLIVVAYDKENIAASKIDSENLHEDIKEFRSKITSVDPEIYMHGKLLYDRLIEPIRNEIDFKKHITIIPHGPLHYLPFSALYTNDKYFIEEYPLRVLPSISVLNSISQEIEQNGSLLVLGNPEDNLPAAEQEARVIASTTDGLLLLHDKATETALRNKGKNFNKIHIASHGVFNNEDPLSSGLLLAGDEQNDGLLTASELFTTELKADLVTLSACETAMSTVSNGDDLVGLTRGFFFAGARSLVASLWEVEDESTFILMEQFYNNLNKYQVDEALRSSQLSLLASEKNHPFYWASFQVMGAIN